MDLSPSDHRYRALRHFLKQARKLAGLSQQQLAARVGQPQSFVSKYERGERRIDVVECFEVARALGMDPSKFMVSLVAAMDEVSELQERGGRPQDTAA